MIFPSHRTASGPVRHWPARRRATGMAIALLSGLGSISAAQAQQTQAQQTPVQAAPSPDSLRLSTLQADAARRDPRTRARDLLAAQSALRLRTLDAERFPTFTANGQANYQSDVVSLPFAVPGSPPFLPPHDSYDASVSARLAIYDPSRAPRGATERATLAESQARVETSIFALRQGVNDAYFGVLRAGVQRAELEAALADLEAQLRVAREQLRERTVLPGAVASLEVEVLRRRQTIAEVDAARGAALTVLANLTGRTLAAADSLPLPDLAGAVTRVRAARDLPRERPEHAGFARSREVLDRQRDALRAATLPRVSAVSRAGYGRPGLNALATRFDEYWIAGLQLEWTPWNWGATARQREALTLQQQIVSAEEAAFSDALQRSIANDLATIDRLERALVDDEQIVALRERILAESRLRHTEGVITSAEYVDRQTDVLAARLARVTHRVQLEETRARYLTTLGVEVP